MVRKVREKDRETERKTDKPHRDRAEKNILCRMTKKKKKKTYHSNFQSISTCKEVMPYLVIKLQETIRKLC